MTTATRDAYYQEPTTRHIELDSGGRITLTTPADVGALSDRDRDFVFELVEHLYRYRQTQGAHRARGRAGRKVG